MDIDPRTPQAPLAPLSQLLQPPPPPPRHGGSTKRAAAQVAAAAEAAASKASAAAATALALPHIKRCDLCAYGCRGERSFTPVESCSIEPVVILGKGPETFDDDDLAQKSKSEIQVFYRWQRGPARAVCFFHANLVAKIQCSVSLRCFCCYECFRRGQSQLRRFYASGGRIQVPRQTNEFSYGVPCRKPSVCDDDSRDADFLHYSLLVSAGLVVSDSEGDTWVMASYSRCYTPSSQDVGHQLRFEVAVGVTGDGRAPTTDAVTFWDAWDSQEEPAPDRWRSASTACVVPQAKYSTKRAMIAVAPTAERCNLQRLILAGSPIAMTLGIGVRWHITGGASGGGAPNDGVFSRARLPGVLSADIPRNNPATADSITAEKIRHSRVAVLTEQRFRRERNLQSVQSVSTSTSSPRMAPGEAQGTSVKSEVVLESSSAEGSERHSFTVMTWNVLADIYVTFDAFPHAPGYVLSWNYRRDRVLAEILSYSPDIICLQEVQGDHFEDFFAPALLRRGYEGLYKQKMSGVFRGSGKHRGGRYIKEGCATFFKVPKFRLRDHFAIEFGRVAVPSHVSRMGKHSKMENSSRINRDNVALVLCLEVLVSAPEHMVPRKIIVANTHILANREAPDVKIWQANTLMTVLTEYVDKCMSSYGLQSAPGLVVCGDFNSMPTSAVYQLVSTGRCDPRHPELLGSESCRWLSDVPMLHGLSLKSSYGVADYLRSNRYLPDARVPATMNLRQFEPEFTNYTHCFVDCLDYIFFDDRSLSVTATLDVVRELQLLEEAHALQLSDWALPSPQRPSDHIPLLARFEWN